MSTYGCFRAISRTAARSMRPAAMTISACSRATGTESEVSVSSYDMTSMPLRAPPRICFEILVSEKAMMQMRSPETYHVA